MTELERPFANVLRVSLPHPRALIESIGGSRQSRLAVGWASPTTHSIRSVPDGRIAFRRGGTDLFAVATYLDHWFKVSS